jgi:predicted  nucleic acid-binding Zn-ribbon protein
MDTTERLYSVRTFYPQPTPKETTMKKEIYESELRKLTNESSELSRSINTANVEIEHLVEVQTALESKLGNVKKEMMVAPL